MRRSIRSRSSVRSSTISRSRTCDSPMFPIVRPSGCFWSVIPKSSASAKNSKRPPGSGGSALPVLSEATSSQNSDVPSRRASRGETLERKRLRHGGVAPWREVAPFEDAAANAVVVLDLDRDPHARARRYLLAHALGRDDAHARLAVLDRLDPKGLRPAASEAPIILELEPVPSAFADDELAAEESSVLDGERDRARIGPYFPLLRRRGGGRSDAAAIARDDEEAALDEDVRRHAKTHPRPHRDAQMTVRLLDLLLVEAGVLRKPVPDADRLHVDARSDAHRDLIGAQDVVAA